MDSFKWGKAWSFGLGFISGRPLYHAVILIGLGIVLPLALQFTLVGGMMGPMNPAMMGQSGLGTEATAGAAMVAVMLVTYTLQTGSYFTSWRIGLDARATPGRALGYGMAAGFIAIAVIAALGILVGGAGALLGTEGAAILLVLALVIPLLAAFAAFYTTLTAVVAVMMALGLALAMLIGAFTGQVGLAATVTGGSGVVTVVLVVLSGVTLWLAARLSCTTSVMADRKSFNLIAAVRTSWELTWEEQWSIMRYLALIGLGVALIFIVVLVAIGASAGAFMSPGGAPPTPATGVGIILSSVALGIVVAFLTVMIPAGIYRELNPPEFDAEVFA